MGSPVLEDSPTPPVQILESRSQFRCCHICVPDQEERLPAIVVDSQYYSFFKTAPNQESAMKIALKLSQKGDTPVLTKTSKGYAIWILEPEASLQLSR
jgi:hypothetical protein